MRVDSRPEYKQKAAPLTVPRGTTLRTAISEMTERNYGSVVIVEPDHTVAGILTERDLMRRVLYEGLDPDVTPVDRVMTTNVKTARQDDDVVDWLRLMSNERFRHLPVVDAEGRVVQMLSQGDFVSYTWPDLLRQPGGEAREGMVPTHHIALIVAGVLGYALLVPFVFGVV
jgi:CBS domain-containing protein